MEQVTRKREYMEIFEGMKGGNSWFNTIWRTGESRKGDRLVSRWIDRQEHSMDFICILYYFLHDCVRQNVSYGRFHDGGIGGGGKYFMQYVILKAYWHSENRESPQEWVNNAWFRLYSRAKEYEKDENTFEVAKEDFLQTGVSLLNGDLEGGPEWMMKTLNRHMEAIDFEGPRWTQNYMWLYDAIEKKAQFPHYKPDFNELDYSEIPRNSILH